MTKYITFLFSLIFVFVSLFMILAPQTLYGHSSGSSHEHPHDPEKTVCTGCAELVTPGSHYCVKDQERDVKISNNEAEIKRMKEDSNLENKRKFTSAVRNVVTTLIPGDKKVTKKVAPGIAVADTINSLFVSCSGCGDPVSDPDEHWGTGGCAVGHKHWTCKESERWAHAGCYWSNKPETNPDKQYEGAKYSMTCPSCSNVRWTNDYNTYMDWQNNQYCYTCQSMYGY